MAVRFACSFCTWGSNIGTKMAAFPLDRLRAEVAWIAKNQIEFVYMGDSNWGMLPQDSKVADMLVEAKSRWGYPKRVLANAPKNSSVKVFDLFDKLKTVGLQKAVTLSMQSWNPETLVSIKRSNIKSKTYEELQTLSKRRDIATYSELILALPGETLQSFCDGIDKSIDGGARDGLLVYLCRVLPGSEMDSDVYRALHGIETVRLPIQANHGGLDAATIGPTEFEETVVATKTMPHADWLEAQRIAWFVEVFFVLGIARLPLLWLREQGVKVTEFARWALDEMRDATMMESDPMYQWLRNEVLRLDEYLERQDAGTPDFHFSERATFGAIRWPIDEASWLALMSNKDEARKELMTLFDAYIDTHFAVDERDTAAVCIQSEIDRGFYLLKHWTTDDEHKTPAEFAKHRVWFGRRGGSLLRDTA